MGLAASQARYLALTARKSDLEFQSQTINTRRIQLAYRTAEIAQAYSEGMNNKQFAISKKNETGNTIWVQATYGNLLEAGYVVIPIPGTSWNDVTAGNPDGSESLDTPCPYDRSGETTDVGTGYYRPKSASSWTSKDAAIAALGVTESELSKYCDIETGTEGETTTWKGTLKASIDTKLFEKLGKETGQLLFDEIKWSQSPVSLKEGFATENPNHAWDLQNMLESGQAQVITRGFYNYLLSGGGDPDRIYNPYSTDPNKLNMGLFKSLQEEWKNNEKGMNPGSQKSIVDWRADETETFQQRNYTEDDAQVLAKYEHDTAEVQAQDKMLEVQEKNIETQHKAIETELEGIQKLIQQNIEKTFKIFS